MQYFKYIFIGFLGVSVVFGGEERAVSYHGGVLEIQSKIDSSFYRFDGISQYVSEVLPRVLQMYGTGGYLDAQVDSIVISPSVIPAVRVYLNPGPHYGWLEILSYEERIDTSKVAADRLRMQESTSRFAWQREIRRHIEGYSNRGYPLVAWKPRYFGTKSDRITIQAEIKPGPLTIIDTIAVINSGETRSDVFIREMRLPSGAPFAQNNIRLSTERIRRFPFVRQVDQPVLFRTVSGKVGLLWEITEQRANRFTGIVGYKPTTAQDPGFFTGLLQFDFVNLFGTAREFHIFWEKQDVISQEMRISYTEPWLFRLPMDLTGTFQQRIQDSTYIERQSGVSLQYHPGWRWAVFLALDGVRIISTPAGRQAGFSSYARLDYTLGLDYSSLDNHVNPRAGAKYRSSVTRRTNIPGLSGSLQAFELHAQGIREIYNPHFVGVSGHLKNIVSPDRRLPTSEYFRFGGATTLRGYDEAVFWGTTTAWLNLEYRLLFEKASRFITFYDYGYFERPGSSGTITETRSSWGIGIRLRTAVGQIGIDYGLPPDTPWQSGRLHVQYNSIF